MLTWRCLTNAGVAAEGQQQLLVLPQKRRGVQFPAVPHEQCPPVGAEDATPFEACHVAIEPVKCLGGDDQVYFVIFKRCGFSTGVDALEVCETGE